MTAEFEDPEKSLDAKHDTTVTLEVFPDLIQKSITVAGITFRFPDADDVYTVGDTISENLRRNGDVRADGCWDVFFELFSALNTATVVLNAAKRYEKEGKFGEMKARLHGAKENLMRAGRLAEDAKQYLEPPTKRIE